MHWQKILRDNFTNIEKLCDFLKLDKNQREKIDYHSSFILNLPKRLAEKIEKKSLEDPILKQFLPLKEENDEDLRFTVDPVGDTCFQKEKKLLHKYKGRVLLVCTSACAMHCRYCFRRHFSYECYEKTFEKELNLIKNDLTVSEVILSGGDPLSLSDQVLDYLLDNLCKISHVKRIRFHTRFPIGIPERIDASFLQILSKVSIQMYFVLHINHPKELDEDIFLALRKLQKLGIVILNQAVFLRGVNDSPEVLKQLCEKLIDNGVIPYYFHQLDQVKGAKHFEADIDQGKAMINFLRKTLPGYAVPQYVREEKGQPSKTPFF